MNWMPPPSSASDEQGNIYAIGGGSGSVTLSTVEKYSPSSNTWTQVESLPTPVFGLGAAKDKQGNIYAIDGWAAPGTAVGTAEKFAPSTTLYLFTKN